MIKRLGVVLFAKLQELAKGIAEGVSIVLQGNKKMEASSKKVSKSIEQSFGQGAKNAIKQTGEQMLIQTDILRDLEMGLKKLEEQQKATGKYDFQAQAKIKKAIKEQTQAIADQKFALQGLKMQQQESKAALSESRAVAEDNSQAMEALSRAVNAAAMATLLLGDDNKKLQPAINAVRVVMAGASAAMALYNLSLRENNVLTMLSGKLQKAYAVVVGTSTGAMKIFRIALASTGVGVLIVALGALVAKLMETTDVTDEAAEAMKDYEKNLQKTSDTIDYQIGELERKAELEELNARKAGKSEAYINKLKRKSLADQIAYLESKKDAEDKAWFNEWEKIQLSSKSEEEKTKLQQELTDKTAQYTKKITQQIDALKHQSRVNEINEDIKLSEEQKSIQLKKLEDFQKAEEERQKGFKQYRAEQLSEEKKFQQLSIDQMAEGKAKELAQLKFNFEQEIAEVKYSQELKKALTDKYNKDVAAVNSKYYYQELEQIGENLTAYVKAQKAKREENKKTTKSITEENQRLNSQLISLQEQFYADMALAIGQAFAGGNPMEGLFKVMGNTFAMFLETIGRAMIALSGIAEAFKTIALTGAPALIAGVGLIAAAGFVRAKINNTPKFAKGGIVSGPTLGLMGEYPGASSNPEVIAPLDKLQSMLGGSADGSGFIAETRVSGRDLSIVLNRYNKEANRT
jgi:hypothetical protein